MEQTPNLPLPYIMPSQAQKHVTHNEAIRMLDAVVQLSVVDRDLTAPPGSPVDGSRYLVAASPTGAWAGQAAKIAAWQDGAWAFLTPRAGWLVWVADEARLLSFNGSAWIDAAVHSVNPIAIVGVNAMADATNRLSVKSPAALFDNESGDHRLKVNKAASGNTASILFQTSYSGRAEFGLAGDDNWQVKVSPDGSSWIDALKVDAATGRVRLPTALALSDDNQVAAKRHIREILTANRTYYVRTDGSDSNNGLANTSGGAFLTIQKAIDTAVSLDLSIYTITIQVGSGTYTGTVRLKPFLGVGPITLRGDTTTPSNCVISTTSASAIANLSDTSVTGWSVIGFRLQTTTSGNGISMSLGSVLSLGNMDFGACVAAHCLAASSAVIRMNAGYTISGNAAQHWLAAETGVVFPADRAVTISGTPAFSSAFAYCARNGLINAGNMSFSGSATGQRYTAVSGGVIDTAGGGASYLPGSSAGSATSPGAYV